MKKIIIGVAVLSAIFLAAYFQGRETYSASETTEQVTVTAEVPLDCTSPTHMYTEECLMRVTDDVAGSFADLKRAESTLQKAQDLYNQAFTEHSNAIDRLNMIMK